MSTTSKLSKASSLFFISGFVIGKVNYLQIPVVSSLCAILALLLNMIGYTLWIISSRFYPEQTRKIKEWYGFAQFKEQHLLASVIGIAGTLLSLAAIACPVLIIPAVWLFFASNVIWSISEYHKLNNPQDGDRTYSRDFQENYFSYTLIVSTVTVVAALSATLIFAFPAISLPLLIISTITIVGLSLLSTDVWLSFTFGDHQKPADTTPEADSHAKMNRSLGATVTNDTTPLAAPAASHPVFVSPNQVKAPVSGTDAPSPCLS